MRFILAIVLLTAAYAGATYYLLPENSQDAVYAKVTDVNECVDEDRPYYKDMCIMYAAMTNQDKQVCYRIGNPEIAMQCFKSFLVCKFPYEAHYGRDKCVIGLERTNAIIFQWMALVAAAALVFRWGKIRSWFRYAMIFFTAAMFLYATQPALIAAAATALAPVEDMVTIDSDVGNIPIYLSLEGVIMLAAVLISALVGALAGNTLKGLFPED